MPLRGWLQGSRATYKSYYYPIAALKMMRHCITEAPKCTSAHRAMRVVIVFMLLISSALAAATAVTSESRTLLVWLCLLPLLFAVKNFRLKYAVGYASLWGATVSLFCLLSAKSAPLPSFPGLIELAVIPAVYVLALGEYRRRFGFSPLAAALGWVIIEIIVGASGIRPTILLPQQDAGGLLHILTGFFGCGAVAFLIAYTNAVFVSIADGIRLNVISFLFLIDRADYSRDIPDETIFTFSRLTCPPPSPRAPPLMLGSVIY